MRMGMSALVVCVFGLVATAARADEGGANAALFEAGIRQQWAGIDREIELRKIDREALATAQEFRSGEHAPPVTAGEQGRVVFAFGSTIPKVLCTPRRICDIELQPGESIQSAMAGDPVGWVLEPARAGATQHVVLKPQLPMIETNLAIYTDRRVYHIELQSTAKDHMPFISFTYPEDAKTKWLALAAQRNVPGVSKAETKGGDEYEVSIAPGSLHFNYKVSLEGRWLVRRNIKWAPVRVFDDGSKTIIEMPRAILAHELPVLLVREGDGQDKLVNFTVKGTRFLVDRLFTKAVLVKGVGWWNQERVAIEQVEE